MQSSCCDGLKMDFKIYRKLLFFRIEFINLKDQYQVLFELHNYSLKLCSKQHNKIDLLHLILAPQLSGAHNITTQLKQVKQVGPMSSLYILLCRWYDQIIILVHCFEQLKILTFASGTKRVANKFSYHATSLFYKCKILYRIDQGTITDGKAQYSWPPHQDSLFCKNEKYIIQC